MRPLFASVVLSSLVLTGCSPSEKALFSDEPLKVQSVVRASSSNEWVRACKSFRPGSTGGFGVAYDAVIAEACAKARPNSFKASAVVSPSVSARNVSRYMDSLRFHESYWGTRINPSFTSPLRVVFSEKDQKWWAKRQKQYLIKPELGWFTSKSEGSHCRVQADIFCPKHFEGALTKSGTPVEFRIIGSQLSWQNWQLTNGAHEAVHIYQDSHSQSFWSFWYIEGQATFFELAMARLVLKSDTLRKSFVVYGPKQNDSIKFNAKTPEGVAKYFNDCKYSGSGCSSFNYGGGSLFHEKLVLDYGLKKYFEWQDWLNSNMPRGDMGKLSPIETETLYKTFAKSFEVVFGITQEHFETKVMPQYFLNSYRALSN